MRQQETETVADRMIVTERIHTFAEADSPETSSGGAVPPGIPQAVAVRNGRVLAVGTAAQLEYLIGAETVVERHPMSVLVPGLIDSHTHVVLGTELTRGIQLTDLSLAEVRERLTAAAQTAEPGEWLLGWGVDPNIFTETGFTGRILDDATSGRPAFLRMRDAHSAVMNSKGIEAVGLTGEETFADESEVGVDEEGNPTGYLLELAAIDMALERIPAEPQEQMMDRLAAVLDGMAEVGITSTHVLDCHPRTEELLTLLEQRRDLPVRLRISPMVPPGSEEDVLAQIAVRQGVHGRRWRIEGVKFMIDGTVDNGSAWLEHPDCYGQGTHSLWTEPDSYRRALRYFAERGIATATHAIGDRGVAFVLDSIESLGELARRAAHRIEHIETVPDETVARFAELGVAASMQPIHGVRHTLADRTDNWSTRLGRERAERGWRAGDLRRSGATVALGSDWPVTPYDPRAMMAETVMRRPLARPDLDPVQPEQALTIREALEGYTTHSAHASGLHDEGAIAVGAHASFTLFASDPLTMSAEEFASAPVVATYVEGAMACST